MIELARRPKMPYRAEWLNVRYAMDEMRKTGQKVDGVDEMLELANKELDAYTEWEKEVQKKADDIVGHSWILRSGERVVGHLHALGVEVDSWGHSVRYLFVDACGNRNVEQNTMSMQRIADFCDTLEEISDEEFKKICLDAVQKFLDRKIGGRKN